MFYERVMNKTFFTPIFYLQSGNALNFVSVNFNEWFHMLNKNGLKSCSDWMKHKVTVASIN